MISITKWSDEKKDDCSVITRGRYSIFTWGNDAYSKRIDYSPLCPIPLMQVNDNNKVFTLFLDKFKTQFIDAAADDQLTRHEHNGKNSTHDVTFDDKQSTEGNVASAATSRNITKGDVVKTTHDGSPQIAIITDVLRLPNKQIRYRIRKMNETEEKVAKQDDIQLLSPDPGDIPTTPSEVDAETL